MKIFELYGFPNYFITSCGKIYFNENNVAIEINTSSFLKNINSNILKLLAFTFIGPLNLEISCKHGVIDRHSINYIVDRADYISEDQIKIADSIFKKIKGCASYFINNYGLIYSSHYNKILHHKISDVGYWVIALVRNDGKRKMYTISRLVFDNWIGPLDSELVINHMDGNKWNNRIDNLEQITQLGNVRHAMDNELRYRKFTETEIHNICIHLQDGLNNREIFQILGYPESYYKNFNVLVTHLLQNTKFWVDISSQYDFSKHKNVNHVYSDELVHIICKLFEDGKSNKEVIAITGTPFKFVSELRCRTARCNISNKYSF